MKLGAWLLRINPWHFLWIAFLLAEILAAISNGALSLIWWGTISRDLLIIGAIDVIFIAPPVAFIVIFSLKHATGLIRANELLQQKMEEQQITEAALRESEERFELCVKGSNDGLWDWRDVDRDHLWASPRIYEMLGYRPEEIRPGLKLFKNLLHPDDRDGALQAVATHLEKRGPFDIEFRLKNKYNRYHWFRARGQALWDRENRPGRMAGSIQDITQLKRAEEERVRLATAIEQTADSIIITDRQGIIRYTNPSFERASGYSRAEIIGRNFSLLKSDKHAERFYADMWRTIALGKTWSGHIINRMKDGSLREFETTISPIRDAAGKVADFVSVNRDVTHEVELENQLRQAQKMESIGTLAGGIAHDFNNILSAIIGFTEISIDDVPKDSRLHTNLTEVLKAGDRAKELVRQILTFSRQTEQELRPVQVQSVADEALRLLRASLPSTIQISANLASTSAVMADPTQLHQVLMNLCTNAAHAISSIGGEMSVNLTDDYLDEEFAAGHPEIKSGRFICLEVSDTGHGMPAEVMQRVFDPFFTTKDRSKGTGMGLAVVHGIVQSHHGTITVASRPGRGSTFKVYLPVISMHSQAKEDVKNILPFGDEHILFVDDESALVELCEQMLSRLGYTVTTCIGSHEALQVFKTDPARFDLVITDMTMPQMTGDVLAAEIMGIRKNIPIILCTGYSEQIAEENAKLRGLRGFVMKPIDMKALARMVRSVLDDQNPPTHPVREELMVTLK